MYYKPTLVAAPSTPVISLDEAKLHLRVEGTDEDTLVEGLIAAALGLLDGYAGILGRCLIHQTWQVTADDFCRRMRLPMPAASIASIKARDSAGTLSAAIASTNYDLQQYGRGSRVRFKDAYDYPGDLAETEAVVIQFVAGYGAAATDVPPPIKLGMLLLIGHWFTNREAVGIASFEELPLGAKALFAPFRLIGV
jgi:uncharacterized phiE125 gp8 family phage protein